MELKKILSITYYIGMALVFLGVLMGVAHVENHYIVLLVGSIPIIGVRVYNLIVGRVENRRVFTILVYSSAFLLPAVWALATDRGYWIIFIMLTAVIDSYASFRRFKK
ncbi:hypothetical protein [Carboxylicivirga sp. N1Y90]|uniref:hypothetical protein n=1 Tax=Carboxylicivirga fragile TaxID=3417571 RepID=UPI003D33F5E7|nr:hypothetical protein [Marinilabiliaceae bacterium N1Y90]